MYAVVKLENKLHFGLWFLGERDSYYKLESTTLCDSIEDVKDAERYRFIYLKNYPYNNPQMVKVIFYDPDGQ